jgi:hypothetical protein
MFLNQTLLSVRLLVWNHSRHLSLYRLTCPGENWKLQLRAQPEKVYFQGFLLTAQMMRWTEGHPSCRTFSAAPQTKLAIAPAIALFPLLISHDCRA